MLHKILIIAIYIVLTLIILLLLLYGVSKSDFTNIRKYDEKDTNIRSKLKEKIAKERYYTTRVKITSNSMASLGDFTLNISQDRKLTTNISLKFKDKESDYWLPESGIKQEILDKGDVLRSVVIDVMSNKENAITSNDKMRKKLVDNMNNYLSNGKIEDIYFNKFIIQ